MRKITKCCLFIIIVCLASCSKDCLQESKIEYIKVEDGQLLDVIKDSILNYNIENCHFANDEIINPNKVETLNGFLISSAQERHWVRVTFSNGEAPGLQNSVVYFARSEDFYQHIPTSSNNEIAVPYTSQPHTMGVIEGKNLYTIGYTHSSGDFNINDVSVNCKTTLLHIGYDSNGNKVNKYFPCAPKDLTWNYSWFNLNK